MHERKKDEKNIQHYLSRHPVNPVIAENIRKSRPPDKHNRSSNASRPERRPVTGSDAVDAKKEANQTLFVTTLNDYMNNGGCWFCSTFASLLTAINKLATTIFKELSNLFMILLGLGLLFIILFKVGKMLIQLQEVNLMQFLQDLFKPLGRGMIAAALLTTFTTTSAVVTDDNIFSLLITPFLELSLSLSSKIITTILSFS